MADRQQMSEDQLITQALDGDIAAFNDLVLAYQDRVYTQAYRVMGEPAAAADMAQEAFITAYRKLDTFRGGSFLSWILRIVTNRCYDELRRHKRRPAISIEDLPGADMDDGPPLPSAADSPEEVAQTSELSQAIQDCIISLNEEQRIVLVMSDVQGMSYQEIADTLRTRIGTIKSRLSRARLGVRNCLQSVQELLPPEFRLVK